MKHSKPGAPLFEEYTVAQLTRLIPYEESYLEELVSGRQPIRPRFRRTVARILGRSEVELFDGVSGGLAVSSPEREQVKP